MRRFLQSMEDSGDGFGESPPELTVEADTGLCLAVIAVALLAFSTFAMRARRRPQPYRQAPPPPVPGPGGRGSEALRLPARAARSSGGGDRCR